MTLAERGHSDNPRQPAGVKSARKYGSAGRSHTNLVEPAASRLAPESVSLAVLPLPGVGVPGRPRVHARHLHRGNFIGIREIELSEDYITEKND